MRLAETGSALAARAEGIVADAKRETEAARKAEATAKETLSATLAALKRRHAEALENKDAVVANVVAACKQEEATREEAAARATKAEARARAPRARWSARAWTCGTPRRRARDAELAAERHERKSKTYRDENETLVLKYDRAMRALAAAADEAGAGRLGAGRGGGRSSKKRARARARGVRLRRGGGSEGESVHERGDV